MKCQLGAVVVCVEDLGRRRKVLRTLSRALTAVPIYCAIIAVFSSCSNHQITGVVRWNTWRYGYRLTDLHYISQDIVSLGEFTNVVGVPPSDPNEPDEAGLKRVTNGVVHDSPEYIRATNQEYLTITNFDGVLGRWFQMEHTNFPMTSSLLQKVFDDTWLIVEQAKKVNPIRKRPDGSTNSSSYPSGHAAEGLVLAEVLKQLDPLHGDQAEQCGREIGRNRLVLNRHYPSDVEAGRQVGAWVLKQISRSGKYQRDFHAAQEELRPHFNRSD